MKRRIDLLGCLAYVLVILIFILMITAESMLCYNPIKLKTGYTVPCGKCYACAHNHRNSWSFRLKEEVANSESAYFITLTYNNENLRELNKREIQLFLKSVREFQRKLILSLSSTIVLLSTEVGMGGLIII